MKVAVLLLSCLLVAGVSSFNENREELQKRADIEVSADGALGDQPPTKEEIEMALKKTAVAVDEALVALEDSGAEVTVGGDRKREAEMAVPLEPRAAEEEEEEEYDEDEPQALKRKRRGWRVRLRVSFDKKRGV